MPVFPTYTGYQPMHYCICLITSKPYSYKSLLLWMLKSAMPNLLSVLLGPNAFMDEYGTVAYFIDYNYKTLVSIKTKKNGKKDTY